MPEAPCAQDDCYLGMPLHTTDGQWFVHGLTLPANLAEVDSYLYKKQRAKFDNLVTAGKHLVNTTIVLDTDKAKNIRVGDTDRTKLWVVIDSNYGGIDLASAAYTKLSTLPPDSSRKLHGTEDLFLN